MIATGTNLGTAVAESASARVIDPGVALARPLNESSVHLREVAAAMSKSIARVGVADDEPLGQLLRSFQEMVVAFSEAGAGTAERVEATIKNTRELSISEVHRLRQATALAEETTKSLRATEVVVKMRTEQAIGNLIASMKPDLIKALRATTVIREQSWNRRQNLIGVTGMACLLVGLFGIGYVMGGGDFRSRSAGDQAQAAVARCFASARPNPIVSTSTCPVVTLIEPGG